MLKFLLLSIVLVSLLVPASAAKVRDPRRALLSMLTTILIAELGYALFLLVVYPRIAWW